MTDFTTYKTTTGDITSCGSTNVSLSDIALQTDESVIEGIYEAEKYKIISGSAVEQTIDWKKSPTQTKRCFACRVRLDTGSRQSIIR